MLETQKGYVPINLSLLQAGEPIAILGQIGYGDFYLSSVTTAFDSGYNKVSIVFTNRAGNFSPPSPIFLTPQNTTETNKTLTSAQQKLNIETIQLGIPTDNSNGYVYLKATYTDIEGKESKFFNGYIAEWTSKGPLKDTTNRAQ